MTNDALIWSCRPKWTHIDAIAVLKVALHAVVNRNAPCVNKLIAEEWHITTAASIESTRRTWRSVAGRSELFQSIVKRVDLRLALVIDARQLKILI